MSSSGSLSAEMMMMMKNLFVCLFERGNLKNYWFELKNIFVLDSPFVEEDYRLYKIIKLRPIGAEQRVYT